MICPLMSKVADGSQSGADLVEVRCKEKYCALWVTQKDLISEKYIERCGLIK